MAKKKPKHTDLNPLQLAQLRDCIKAGSTPVIGRKNEKGWTDTPLFKTHLEEQQTKLF
jgi:hypothetical protein